MKRLTRHALLIAWFGALISAVTAAPLFTSETKLLASDAAAGDTFGYPVAISGDTIVAGASGHATAGIKSGAAYVFVHSGSGWIQQQELTASDGASGDRFGISAAVNGDTAIIGAPGNGGSGAVYVFARSGGVWTQQQKLVPSGAAPGQQFGNSLALSGDTLVVGAIGDSAAGYLAGAAYVFVRTAGGWVEQQKFIASDATTLDEFGLSVAISRDTIVVATPLVTDAVSHSGAAYVFQRTGTVWTEQQKLTAPDPTPDENFGSSVAVDADTIVVGAYSHPDAGFVYAGTAYVFVRQAGTWTLQQKLTASDPSAYNQFGVAVAVRDNTTVVGSSGLFFPGFVYVFERSAGTWTQQQILKASDAADFSQFGNALALSTDRLAVGAIRDDQAPMDAGAVYVYEADNKPPVIAAVTATPNVLWPPNHRMIPVTITVAAHDDLDPAPICRIISVTSNDGINCHGAGHTSPDWKITGALTVNLRAERSGRTTGRTYTITVKCTDHSGNRSTATVTVRVPHDRRHRP